MIKIIKNKIKELFNKKIKLNNKNNSINKLNFLEGSFNEKDFLAPSYINNLNSNYIKYILVT